LATFEIDEATVSTVHSALIARDPTAAELVEAYLRRVDQYDGHLNAVVTLNGSVGADAAVMNEHLMAT